MQNSNNIAPADLTSPLDRDTLKLFHGQLLSVLVDEPTGLAPLSWVMGGVK